MQERTHKCAHRPLRLLQVVMLSIGVGLLSTAAPSLADLRVVPSLTISERYDSNVLFTSAGDNDDFITSVTPALSATYRGRPLEATLTGSTSFSYYAKNPDFNYVSATGALSVDLTQLVGRLDKRARLQLAQSVFYTPELPAFLTAAEGSKRPAAVNPFATGIQPQRVRSFSYTSSAAAGYKLTPRVDLTAGYSYSFLNFGSTVGAPAQTALFRTALQAVNAGPDIKLTLVDTLNVQYLYTKADFNGGAVQGFHTQGGTVGLTHVFSPQLTGSIAAGATVISQTDRVAPLARLSASWTERNTVTTFSFSRSVTPSFTIAATSLESNLVALSVSHKLTARLLASADVNYARSSSASATSATQGSDLLFESYGANLILNYSVARWLTATFSYSHTHFNQGFSNSTSSFDRDVVMLSLTASWL